MKKIYLCIKLMTQGNYIFYDKPGFTSDKDYPDFIFLYYKGDGQSISLAEKELFFSIEKTYELYFHLLQFSVEITHYAALKNRFTP